MPCMCGGCHICLRDQGYPTECVVCNTPITPGDPWCGSKCEEILGKAYDLLQPVRDKMSQHQDKFKGMTKAHIENALDDVEVNIAKAIHSEELTPA